MSIAQNNLPDQRALASLLQSRRLNAGLPTAASSTQRYGVAPLPPGQDTLVFVFLRGGMDGMSLCAPYGDPDYTAVRPSQAIPNPGQAGGAVDLDGFFGLNPAAGALLNPYTAGDLAFVHTVGSTDPSQSHFDAMKFIESGFPNQPLPAGAQNSGWLGRHMAQGSSPVNMRGIILEPTITLTAAGAPKTLPMPDPGDFSFSGHTSTMGARRALLGLMYERAAPLLANSASATLAAIDELGAIDFDGYVPANSAVYTPGSYFAYRMQRAAALIKANIGLEILEVDLGGWDDHDDMGANGGNFAVRAADLADTLNAFYTDLGNTMDRVTVVVMSEFGRRVEENGSGGTDHGRGGLMLLMGKNVMGGQVRHDWQGLTPADLNDGNLQVRLDYRNVLSEVLEKRLGNVNLAGVFPNHTANFYNLIS